MTLLATFRIGERAVLLGDMLVSAAGSPGVDDPDDFPAAGSVRGKLTFRADTARKVGLVTDRLAVGWAGSVVAAREALMTLYGFPQDTNVTEEELRRRLSSFRPPAQPGHDECSLVGCAIGNEGSFSYRWDSNEPGTLRVFQADHLIGSGGPTLTRLIETGRMRGNTAGSATRAVALSGQLLLAEAKTGESLLNRFGAGYEVIVEDSGRLRLVDSVTYVVVRAANDLFQVLPWFIKHGHEEDVAYEARVTHGVHANQVVLQGVLPSSPRQDGPTITRERMSLRSEYYCVIVDTNVDSSTLSLCAAFDGRTPDVVSVAGAGEAERVSISDNGQQFLRTEIGHASELARVGGLAGLPRDGQFLSSGADHEFSLRPGFFLFAVLSLSPNEDGSEATFFDVGLVTGTRASVITVGSKLRVVLQDDRGRPASLTTEWGEYFGRPTCLLVTFEELSGELAIWRNNVAVARVVLPGFAGAAVRGAAVIGSDLTKSKPANFTVGLLGTGTILSAEDRRTLHEQAKAIYGIGN